MRLVSFRVGGADRFGLVEGEGIVDLSRRLPEFPDLLSVLRAEALPRLAAFQGEAPDYQLADVELLIPVTAPEKIICIGVNYAKRESEMGANVKMTSYPNMFPRFPRTFVGHGKPLVRPKVSEQLDYEGELCLVIGKTGRHIAPEDALAYVGAVTLANEGTIRDWVRHAAINVTQGKNFESSGSMGPWLVTADAVDLTKPIRVTTRVNGKTVQDDTTASLVHDFRSLLAYISTFISLVPGDIILTGTPAGAGSQSKPPVWLKPGDVIEVESDAVGILSNGVVDEA